MKVGNSSSRSASCLAEIGCEADMKLGFVILAHQNLPRLEQLARHLSQQGCPMCIHIDRDVPKRVFDCFAASVSDLKNVSMSKRTACEWGRFSIVQATLDASEMLLARHPDVTNILLISGSCLPVRPVKQLRKFLQRNEKTDFIESVSVRNNYWVKGGLNEERFTLYFPFSWQKQRKLFDTLVDVQRKLKIERTLPEGLVPHIGSQWWCLTARTLRAILMDPRRPHYDSYFSRSWIPDESYFQTLARAHARKIESRSLTFSKFDYMGKPFNFYDDHIELLTRSNCFMGRKIWAGADLLYKELLDPDRSNQPMTKSNPREFEAIFEEADKLRCEGGVGRFNQGRFPYNQSGRTSVSATPYTVYVGYKNLFEHFPAWLEKHTNTRAFSSVFSRSSVCHKRKFGHFAGNLPAQVEIRNRNPKAYLANLLWPYRDRHQSFLFDFRDHSKILETLISDPHATIVVIRHSWLMHLLVRKLSFAQTLTNAKRLHRLEELALEELAKPWAKAKVKIVELDTAVNTPSIALAQAVEHIPDRPRNQLQVMPTVNPLDGMEALVKRLRNHGLNIKYEQARKPNRGGQSARPELGKPYVVK